MGQIGRAVPGDVVAQVLALHVLLGDVVQLIDAAHLVNLHDVGVDQRGGGLGLELEPLQVGPIAGQLRLEDLDGHAAFQPLLLGQIDLGHRPASQPPQQMEIAQLPAGKIGIGGWGRGTGIRGRVRTWRFVGLGRCRYRTVAHGSIIDEATPTGNRLGKAERNSFRSGSAANGMNSVLRRSGLLVSKVANFQISDVIDPSLVLVCGEALRRPFPLTPGWAGCRRSDVRHVYVPPAARPPGRS